MKQTTKKVTAKTKKELEKAVEPLKTDKELETVKVEESVPKKIKTEAEMKAEEFRKEYKEVYITEVADLQIVWRKLKRSEYKEAMMLQGENEALLYYDRQEFMAKKVILYPTNVDELIEDYAGVADIIATETMVKTGFGLANTITVDNETK